MPPLHELFLYPILAIILSILLHRWRAAAFSAVGKRLPPSPSKLPIIGNLHQLGKFPHRSLQSLSDEYGPLILLHLGRVPVLVASSAAAAREIMKEQDLTFSNRPKLSSPDWLIYGSRGVTFAPLGDYWRQMRSIFVLRLLSNKRVQSYRRVREEETSLMVEELRRSTEVEPDVEVEPAVEPGVEPVVNLSEALVALTGNVICRVALGRKYEGSAIRSFFVEFLELLGTSPVGDYVPWLGWTNRFSGLDKRRERMAKRFDDFLEQVVREHREMRERVGDDGGEMDFVDILLEFQRESQNSSLVEDDVIKALILDVFSAGIDTTSNALDWTMVELMRNPFAMKTLQNEVRESVGSKGKIGEEDLVKMPYLKAVIKENLRLHPPAPLLVPRESTRDTKVLGYDVAAGTRIMINAWKIGRDPSVWENPEKFYPERFLETSIEFKGFHFELLPFGAGRRGCPGIAFATAVYELALAKLVYEFDFGLPNGGRGEDLDMTEDSGITIHRKFPLLVVITPRV